MLQSILTMIKLLSIYYYMTVPRGSFIALFLLFMFNVCLCCAVLIVSCSLVVSHLLAPLCVVFSVTVLVALSHMS